jgi:hypothetical protein
VEPVLPAEVSTELVIWKASAALARVMVLVSPRVLSGTMVVVHRALLIALLPIPLLLIALLLLLRAIGLGLVLTLILTTGIWLLPFTFIWSSGLVFLLGLVVLLGLLVIFRLLVILWLIGFIFVLRIARSGRDQEQKQSKRAEYSEYSYTNLVIVNFTPLLAGYIGWRGK